MIATIIAMDSTTVAKHMIAITRNKSFNEQNNYIL